MHPVFAAAADPEGLAAWQSAGGDVERLQALERAHRPGWAEHMDFVELPAGLRGRAASALTRLSAATLVQEGEPWSESMRADGYLFSEDLERRKRTAGHLVHHWSHGPESMRRDLQQALPRIERLLELDAPALILVSQRQILERILVLPPPWPPRVAALQAILRSKPVPFDPVEGVDLPSPLLDEAVALPSWTSEVPATRLHHLTGDIRSMWLAAHGGQTDGAGVRKVAAHLSGPLDAGADLLLFVPVPT